MERLRTPFDGVGATNHARLLKKGIPFKLPTLLCEPTCHMGLFLLLPCRLENVAYGTLNARLEVTAIGRAMDYLNRARGSASGA
jgi:hypothetical protein